MSLYRQKYLVVEEKGDNVGIVGFKSHVNLRCYICMQDECPHTMYVADNRNKIATIGHFYATAPNQRKTYNMDCLSSKKIPYKSTVAYGNLIRQQPKMYLPKDADGNPYVLSKLLVETGDTSKCSRCDNLLTSAPQSYTLFGRDSICAITGNASIFL